MKKLVRPILLASLAAVMPPALPQEAAANAYSLDALQGGWWADCDAPAVEFFISSNAYSGDFEGAHELTLTGDVLVFTQGFVAGHGIEVSGSPLAFRILELSETMLALRPLDSDDATSDWHLRTCEDTSSAPISPGRRLAP